MTKYFNWQSRFQAVSGIPVERVTADPTRKSARLGLPISCFT
jgi:hypothetical protein